MRNDCIITYYSQCSSQSLPDSAVSGGNGGNEKEMLSLLKTQTFSSGFLDSLRYYWDEGHIPAVVMSCTFSLIRSDSSLTGLNFSLKGLNFSLITGAAGAAMEAPLFARTWATPYDHALID